MSLFRSLSVPNHKSKVVWGLTFFLILHQNSAAYLVGPHPWIQETEDGQFILACIPTVEEVLADFDGSWGDPGEQSKAEQDILIELSKTREQFPVTGLYRNNESPTLVWEARYSWTYEHCHVSSDGQYVVFPGTWTDRSTISNTGWRAGIADFCNQGHVFRSVEVEDVFSTHYYQLRFWLFGGNSPTCSAEEFDPANLTYTIRISNGRKLTWDVSTGNLLQDSHAWHWYALYCVLILIVIAGIYYCNRQRASRLA